MRLEQAGDPGQPAPVARQQEQARPFAADLPQEEAGDSASTPASRPPPRASPAQANRVRAQSSRGSQDPRARAAQGPKAPLGPQLQAD